MPRPCRHGCSQLLPLPPLLQCQYHSTALGVKCGDNMVNDEQQSLIKTDASPPFALLERSEKPSPITPLWFRAMLAPDPSILVFPMMYRVARHLIKELTGGLPKSVSVGFIAVCPPVHPVGDQLIMSSSSCRMYYLQTVQK